MTDPIAFDFHSSMPIVLQCIYVALCDLIQYYKFSVMVYPHWLGVIQCPSVLFLVPFIPVICVVFCKSFHKACTFVSLSVYWYKSILACCVIYVSSRRCSGSRC